MKVGDHVKIKDNHHTRSRNLEGRYGHITSMDTSDPESGLHEAVVQFNDFSDILLLSDIVSAGRGGMG
jgi:hypothetical protein